MNKIDSSIVRKDWLAHIANCDSAIDAKSSISIIDIIVDFIFKHSNRSETVEKLFATIHSIKTPGISNDVRLELFNNLIGNMDADGRQKASVSFQTSDQGLTYVLSICGEEVYRSEPAPDGDRKCEAKLLEARALIQEAILQQVTPRVADLFSTVQKRVNEMPMESVADYRLNSLNCMFEAKERMQWKSNGSTPESLLYDKRFCSASLPTGICGKPELPLCEVDDDGNRKFKVAFRSADKQTHILVFSDRDSSGAEFRGEVLRKRLLSTTFNCLADLIPLDAHGTERDSMYALSLGSIQGRLMSEYRDLSSSEKEHLHRLFETLPAGKVTFDRFWRR